MARGVRVIGGSVGGRRLVVPRAEVRPTTDRVKEALFNVLAREVVDARVLDLFAGSGALGIEALSRGAAHAVFVDAERRAVAAVRENLERLGLTDRATVERSSAGAYLARAGAGVSFDLVLLDPPYDTAADEIGALLDALASGGRMAPGASVVVERARSSGAPPLPPGWETRFERSYGDTLLVVAAS